MERRGELFNHQVMQVARLSRHNRHLDEIKGRSFATECSYNGCFGQIRSQGATWSCSPRGYLTISIPLVHPRSMHTRPGPHIGGWDGCDRFSAPQEFRAAVTLPGQTRMTQEQRRREPPKVQARPHNRHALTSGSAARNAAPGPGPLTVRVPPPRSRPARSSCAPAAPARPRARGRHLP